MRSTLDPTVAIPLILTANLPSILSETASLSTSTIDRLDHDAGREVSTVSSDSATFASLRDQNSDASSPEAVVIEEFSPNHVSNDVYEVIYI